MIVRPEAARQVELLREDLFMYGEDIEWCWRLRRAGWRIGVCSARPIRPSRWLERSSHLG